jgi:choline dehydrogenase-like flavoprotein
MAKEKISYDAIVIGSGISGGYAAMELSKKGLQVLMIERGRSVEHVVDYTTALTPPWEMPHRGKAPLELLKDYPKTARVYNKINEYSAHFYTKDALHPYLEDKRFDWIRGYQLGGKSITWGRIALRMSDLDFEANAKEGIAIDWPLRYKDLDPWYDYVEKFVGISGNVDKIPHLPDGVFQPPMPFSCVEKDFQQKNKKFGGAIAILALTTVIGCSYPLNTGDSITVNQRTGRLTLNNTLDITSYLASSGFFAIPPLTTATIYAQGRGGTATGNITITMSNGYW